jgi:endonuclease/exonuclease/phosphatase family metal-dependent hydrolase
MAGLKLLTLNIEGDRHLARVREVIAAHSPDIVCLPEVFESDCATLAAAGDYDARFGISLRMPRGSAPARDWGVAVLTRVPVRRQELIYYTDALPIREFVEPNDARRLALVTELEHFGREYRIVATHFTWSPDGHANDEQRADFARLKQVLARYPHYALCGDFNAPRGREMFAKFTAELRLIDHLPPAVTTTLDPQFHRMKSTLELVVDTVFSTPHYAAADVRLLEGVSDHKGILTTLERRG